MLCAANNAIKVGAYTVGALLQRMAGLTLAPQAFTRARICGGVYIGKGNLNHLFGRFGATGIGHFNRIAANVFLTMACSANGI